jgi:hypothetical protein
MVDQKRALASLLSAPGKVSADDMPMLQDLLRRYPYAQPLHLLMARATKDEADHARFLATGSLYSNGSTLHKFMYSSAAAEQDLPEVSEEEEIFEEIAEVDIHQYRDTAPHTSQDIPGTALAVQVDDFGIENIVATDFFAFENRLSEEPEPEQVVSKYDDDKLPYTFLWWLAKTRKEHQQIFQPYATVKTVVAGRGDTPAAGNTRAAAGSEFQQQYVEHIFHIQTPFTAEEHLAPTADNLPVSGKGKEIIENFIRKDPQILAPKPEQIDTENKAKKSAEDHNDLVSETLAKIYIEQMLYQKAIETYEKLSLKFPEKSRYFADLIQSINKKI